MQARIHLPQTNSGGSNNITFVGTAAGYKFAHWQLFYSSTAIPTTFKPITEVVKTPMLNETLTIWDTTTIPEDVYTVRLAVTGRDGRQTHDQVVLTVDRSPPNVISISATETFYGNSSFAIFAWATDDITRCTLYYKRSGQISSFTSIEGRELSKEHLFSLELTKGQYEFYISAQNTVGLTTIEDKEGKYFTIDVVAHAISPNGYIETSLGVSSLHIANVVTDFDNDGLPEFVATPLSVTSANSLTLPKSLVIYERTPMGRYSPIHNLSKNINIIDTLVSQNTEIDLESFIPWLVDDTDADGLQEILASDKQRTFLIECTRENGFPVQIVWETPYIKGGKTADLDKDGRTEIVGVDNNNNRILVFENIGDNLFDRTAELINETDGRNAASLHFTIDDFDGDEISEMVFGDNDGELIIFNPIANDTFKLHSQMQLNIDEVKLLTSGDLTGDTIPELVVGGTISYPDLPSAQPIWKFLVLSHSSGKFRLLWEQSIAPYRLNGNSMSIADVNGDRRNELVLLTNPNLYVITWDGTTFIPTYHQNVTETPSIFSADLNENGFDELFLNVDMRVHFIESLSATDSNSLDSLIPWDVSAKPLTPNVVQVKWETIEATQAPTGYTLYRTTGEKSKKPSDDKFDVIAQNITSTRYLDTTVKTDTTYWYAVTAKTEKGGETKPSEAVSVTPRKTPKVVKTDHQTPNWIIVTFDRQMNSNISNERRYLLRKKNQLTGLLPMSAIRDRMGSRVILTFNTEKLRNLTIEVTDQYEIAINNITDIDENPIHAATSPVVFHPDVETIEVKDFTNLRVFPNPVRPKLADRSAVTFDRIPIGTNIQLFTSIGERLETLTVTESDGYRKEWWLTNGSIGDVASGIYIYVLEYETQKKVGKIAVIK